MVTLVCSASCHAGRWVISPPQSLEAELHLGPLVPGLQARTLSFLGVVSLECFLHLARVGAGWSLVAGHISTSTRPAHP